MELATLIKEVKSGHAVAQRYLFDLLSDRMMLVALRYLKDRQDAEEAMLDGFYKLFKNISSFQWQSEAAFYAWVKKIMVNECLMRLRKKNTFTILSESAAEDFPLDEAAFEKLTTKEILNLIVQLPVGYRTVFNLHVMEGYDHFEIATLLGIAEGTSRSQLSKAKLLLQKNLYTYASSYKQQSR